MCPAIYISVYVIVLQQYILNNPFSHNYLILSLNVVRMQELYHVGSRCYAQLYLVSAACTT